jgi:magnesium chelatase family protein
MKASEAWERLRDNEHVKRAVEVALAGKHSLTVIGREGDGDKLLQVIIPHTFLEPCPCGNHGSPVAACSCSVSKILRYRNTHKFRAALMNTLIAIQLETPRPLSTGKGEAFAEVMKRVERAQNQPPIHDSLTNESARDLFNRASAAYNFTDHDMYAVKMVAATIAKLDGKLSVEPQHIAEAIQYRRPQ